MSSKASQKRRHLPHRPLRWGWASAACLTTALAACTGFIEEPDSDGTGPAGGGSGSVDVALQCKDAELDVGPAPIRRLTREQYRNAVQDVFQLQTLPSAADASLQQIPDGIVGGYATTTQAATAVQVDLYVSTAQSIAGQLGTSALEDFAGCNFGSSDCQKQTIAKLGRRLFRRSLRTDSEGDEVLRYQGLYAEIKANESADEAAVAVLTAMLASPSFLYREESVRSDGKKGKIIPITDTALASRLSFFLWQSVPDEELLDLAEKDELSGDSTLEAQVQRMLADPRARRGIRSFHFQWLGIADLPDQDHGSAEWSPELGASMLEETGRFVEHVVASTDGDFNQLLSANYSFLDANVAKIYGIAAPKQPFAKTDLPAHRAGLLTHPSVLSRYGEDPAETLRGKFIREQFLCAPKLSVPDGVDVGAEVDRLETEPCVSCHKRMDLIGLGFADFDSVGAFAPTKSAPKHAPEVAVEPDLGLDDVAGPFDGPAELTARLAASSTVQACFAQHWYRYASGRAEQEGDRCQTYRLGQAFNKSGGNIRELMLTIATSAWFRVRSVTDLEG